jgi:hypothetical protein
MLLTLWANCVPMPPCRQFLAGGLQPGVALLEGFLCELLLGLAMNTLLLVSIGG